MLNKSKMLIKFMTQKYTKTHISTTVLSTNNGKQEQLAERRNIQIHRKLSTHNNEINWFLNIRVRFKVSAFVFCCLYIDKDIRQN